MIDTHCHLLPGIDDGPRTDVDAIGLARHLSGEGIETVLCTPHFSEQYPTRYGAAEAQLRRLRSELDALAIQLETVLAAELSSGMALGAPEDQLFERAISHRYLLVELVASTSAGAIDAVERRLASIGLLPVFAHPERCVAVQRRPELLSQARARGAAVQVVAPSLIGQRGEAVWATAWKLVETGQADLLASDAHRAGGTAALAAAVRLVDSRAGTAEARRLTAENPGRLLDGEVLPVIRQ